MMQLQGTVFKQTLPRQRVTVYAPQIKYTTIKGFAHVKDNQEIFSTGRMDIHTDLTCIFTGLYLRLVMGNKGAYIYTETKKNQLLTHF